MTEARRKYFRLPADAFTLRALSTLETFCGGNPETLDDLYTRTLQISRIANAPRITAEHVGQAQRTQVADSRAGQTETSQ